MSKTISRHTLITKILLTSLLTSLSLYIFTTWKCIVYHRLCRDGIYFDKIAQFSRILRFSHIYCQIFRIRTHGWRKWRTTALTSTKSSKKLLFIQNSFQKERFSEGFRKFYITSPVVCEPWNVQPDVIFPEVQNRGKKRNGQRTMSDQSDQEKCNEKQENAFVKTCVEDWEELEKEYMQLEVWHF